MAAQQKYGVPASVTIAQAIDESGWGHSTLAAQDHNLFGIKGRGPAGSDLLQTHEYLNGQLVTRTASFRVYRTVAESIDDHGRLLATSAYYRTPMAHRHDPNSFAAALTGVYATDPGYGAKLIDLMRRYDLYRFDAAASAGAPAAPASGHARPAPAPARPTPSASAPGASAPTPTVPTPSGPAPTPTVPAPTGPAPSHTTPAPSRPAPGGPATAARTAPAPTGHASAAHTPAAPAPRRRGAAGPTRAPAPSRAARAGQAASGPAPGSADIPGLPVPPLAASAASARPATSPAAGPITETAAGSRLRLPPVQRPAEARARRPRQPPAGSQPRISPARRARPGAARYQPRIPPSVRNAFITAAKGRLLREEPLYRDVASESGVHWQLLAACDWMQCEARPRFSPVHGEKLGTLNADGTVYRTKSEALAQCADELVQLAGTVYRIDLAERGNLSVAELANAFAAFRWGGLLKAHRTSAMEFPYSVAGLTDHHLNMRWPDIGTPDTPDKPGGRFRMAFGAVPIVLCLNYPATA